MGETMTPRIKYAFLMPYIDRATELRKTFESFCSLYHHRNDFEIIIVLDSKSRFPGALIRLTDEYSSRLSILVLEYDGAGRFNPSGLFNQAADNTTAEFLIFTSPECLHKTNILAGLDSEFDQSKNNYVICACEHVSPEMKHITWYQHSIRRNAQYHFCSAVSKKIFDSVGGFDEEFSTGYCFEDDDFKVRIMQAVFKTVTRDDLIVCHQKHKKAYIQIPNQKELWLKNKLLFESKHGTYVEPRNPPR